MIIVFFHVFYFVAKFVYRRYSNVGRINPPVIDQDACKVDLSESTELRSNSVTELMTLKHRHYNDNDSYEDIKSTIRFSPPAYIQRYQAVQNILTNPQYGGKLKKIVDFGCSELGFFYYLKNIIGVEELLFVDIDRSVLESCKQKARPLNVDYLLKRETPLILKVLEGSVTDPDKLLENCDAVVCIELIEHLYPESLTELPYNIFGFIKPKVAIVTTPNTEFNILFTNTSKFRHPDHKFEWTRKQFQDWAHNIVSRFPEYSVSFQGICNGPPGTEDLGTCTQMAVFHKIYNREILRIPAIEGLFKTVVIYEYPYKVDNRSDEQKILDEVVYFIRKFCLNQEEIMEEIPLKKLLDAITNFNISLNYLKIILENNNWTIVNREDGPVVLVPLISPLSNDSLESEFSDHDYSIKYDKRNEEPGILTNYLQSNYNCDVSLEYDDWDNLSYAESEFHNTTNTNFNTNTANMNLSNLNSDKYGDDVTNENRLVNLPNFVINECIFISSFSETKDHENLEIPTFTQIQNSLIHIDSKITEASTSFVSNQSIQESELKNLEKNSIMLPFSDSNSICNIFFEPSKINENVHRENFNSLSICTINNSLENEMYKSFRLSNNTNENTFEEPKYASSPDASASFSCKKEKMTKQNVEYFDSDSNKKYNENLLLCIDNKLENTFKKTDSKVSDLCTYSSKSIIVESNYRRSREKRF